MARKLSRVELKAWNIRELKRQGNRCAVCGAPLVQGKRSTFRGSNRGLPCADHDHDTGFLRGVLCNTCNTGEGKIRTIAIRYGYGKDNYISWLIRLATYLHQRARNPIHPFIHPEHKTEEDKRIKRNEKQRARRVAQKVTTKQVNK